MSAHYRDLFPLWAQGSYVPLKFTRAFILGDVMGCHMGAGGRLQNWDPPRHGLWGDCFLFRYPPKEADTKRF